MSITLFVFRITHEQPESTQKKKKKKKGEPNLRDQIVYEERE